MLKQWKQVLLKSLKAAGVFSYLQTTDWRRKRLLILAYHGFALDDEHLWNPELYMHPDCFRARMQLLKTLGIKVLPLGEAIQRLFANDLPENCVALTIDDGNYDFYKQAHPILQEFGLPATLYLTTFYVHYNRPVFDSACSYVLWKGGAGTIDLQEFNGRDERYDLSSGAARGAAYKNLTGFARDNNLSAEEKDDLVARLANKLKVDYDALCAKRIFHLITPEEAAQLTADGVDIQLHTHRHRTPLDRRLFYREIEENRESIEQMANSNASHFCYPSGVFEAEFLPWLEDLGVVTATTCDPGFVTCNSHPLLLPRIIDTALKSPIEFEGWVTGVAAFLPRRRNTYNPGAKPKKLTLRAQN
jgi:peptidoglycan/xylan/chitin deacetylase (PgdA/CDA1 family)